MDKKGNSTVRGTEEMYDGKIYYQFNDFYYVVVRLFFRLSIQNMLYWFKQLSQTMYIAAVLYSLY